MSRTTQWRGPPAPRASLTRSTAFDRLDLPTVPTLPDRMKRGGAARGDCWEAAVRQLVVSYGVSISGHLLVLLILSICWVAHAQRSASPMLNVCDLVEADPSSGLGTPDSAMSTATLQIAAPLTSALMLPAVSAHALAGIELSANSGPVEIDAHLPSSFGTVFGDDLGEKLTGGNHQTSAGISGGHGSASHEHDGADEGLAHSAKFFGTPVSGERLVFVVDCSGSMRIAHTEAPTRLDRVKLELHRVISALRSEQQFFVIFFNDRSRPMPGHKMRSGTAESKAASLKWIDSIWPEGETDPQAAMRYALKLHPSAIFMLTDGVFNPDVGDVVKILNTSHAKINTVGVGMTINQVLLEKIARDSGGTFRWVP